jgi:hypothetical protein
MVWMDYNISQSGDNFKIEGDWPGEVMGKRKDGTWGGKEKPLYSPGDIYKVNEAGWLVKIGEDRNDTE